MGKEKRTVETEAAARKVKKTRLEIDQESFKKILEVVGKQVDAIQYLFDNIEGRMDQEVIQEVLKLLDYAVFLANLRSNPWALGELQAPVTEATDFDYFQIYLAHRAASQLEQKDITMDCAISDNSEFIRGYSSNGKPVDNQGSDSVDKLLNAWLAAMKFQNEGGQEYNLISKDGVIYKAHKATILENEAGEPLRVSPPVFKSVLALDNGGLEEFVKKHNHSVESIKIQQHPYPEQKIEVAP